MVCGVSSKIRISFVENSVGLVRPFHFVRKLWPEDHSPSDNCTDFATRRRRDVISDKLAIKKKTADIGERKTISAAMSFMVCECYFALVSFMRSSV